MKYISKSSVLLLLLIVFGLFSSSSQTKKINCRKYVYAPVCRGIQAKRALPKLPSSIRETRQSTIIDLDNPDLWKDKDKESNENGLLQIVFQRLGAKAADYENGNDLN